MHLPDTEEYGGIALNEKEKLLDELCVLLLPIVPDIYLLKSDISIVLSKYVVTSGCTEVGPVFTDRNEELLKRFLIAKTVKGCSKRTIKYYGEEIKKFLQRVNKTIDDITAEDIRLDTALRIRRDKVSKTTAGNTLRCVRSFFNWMQKEDLIQKNPMFKVDPIKKDKTQKEAFTEMEIEKMRAAVRDEREAAIIEVLLSTGCRVSELTHIRIDEIEGERVLVHGKGNKDRYVYLNARAELAVHRYLEKRKDSNPYLCPKGKPAAGLKKTGHSARSWWEYPENIDEGMMDINSIRATTQKIAKRVGVAQANPHKFRRTCATMALKRGMPVEQVSRMLGHESIETTQIYLDLNDEEMAYVHRKYVV